ncbi:hypothetical protein SAMN05428957_101220 [Oryzisolibacter propanilivorax]|uniref:Uncharacterized protein n=1 Tax=Oryzisolibacter propanilivorax TaxID=1527607 RepID=A0A1G9P678_9BURK|nr:hypothetical protein [Oryzisolibacter propanilivorax]SDL94240.1 hypothetical protein SAMN05428957_101220 [Oryzisolibacter propanilivorax]
MLRWLLTLLALQFLLGMGVSAYAHGLPVDAGPAPLVATVHDSQHCTAASDLLALEDSPGDVTPDAGIDLPDDQEFHQVCSPRRTAHFSCPGLAEVALACAPPRRLLRPPRA